MRALWVPLWYPSPERANLDVWARELARAVALRCEVHVIHAAEGAPAVAREVDEGIPVTRVGYRQRRRHWVTPYLRAVLSGAAALRREWAFDLVHAHCAFPAGLAGLAVARRYGLPLVVTEHWAPYDQLMLSSRLTAFSIRRVVGGAASVVAVSRALQAEMEQWTGRRDIEVIPCAVDTERFRPAEGERGERRPFRLLFVGHLSHARKRLEDVIDALALVRAEREWRLDVIGGGELLEGYRAQARARDLDGVVVFHGEQALPAIADAMRQCDVFVMPSSYETFGVVYVEALASGVPVIAGRCGGPEDIVSEDVGRLVPPGDVPALARALSEMALRIEEFSPDRLRAFAVERFSLPAVGAQYARVYERALG